MNIVMICTNDPAGMGIAFTKAINRHTEHMCRLITTKTKYNFDYDTDLHFPPATGDRRPATAFDTLEHVLKTADLFHFHTFADEETPIGPFTAKDFIQGKRVVYHQHGEPLRSNPDHYRDLYAKKNARVFVSTPDLLDFLPDATWIPNLVPIEEKLYSPLQKVIPSLPTQWGRGVVLSTGRKKSYQPRQQADELRRERDKVISNANTRSAPITIGQSPTRTEIKDTDTLLRVYARLKAKYNGYLNLDLIENVPHSECLERKRRCRIFFDHMQGYFGVSSLESLSQGVPTIAGLSDSTLARMSVFFQTETFPWVVARNEAQLERRLGELISDPDRRDAIAEESRSFMERAWHPRAMADRLVEEYRRG